MHVTFHTWLHNALAKPLNGAPEQFLSLNFGCLGNGYSLYKLTWLVYRHISWGQSTQDMAI